MVICSYYLLNIIILAAAIERAFTTLQNCALDAFSNLIFTTHLWLVFCSYHHFAEEEMEAPKGWFTFPTLVGHRFPDAPSNPFLMCTHAFSTSPSNPKCSWPGLDSPLTSSIPSAHSHTDLPDHFWSVCPCYSHHLDCPSSGIHVVHFFLLPSCRGSIDVMAGYLQPHGWRQHSKDGRAIGRKDSGPPKLLLSSSASPRSVLLCKKEIHFFLIEVTALGSLPSLQPGQHPI